MNGKEVYLLCLHFLCCANKITRGQLYPEKEADMCGKYCNHQLDNDDSSQGSPYPRGTRIPSRCPRMPCLEVPGIPGIERRKPCSKRNSNIGHLFLTALPDENSQTRHLPQKSLSEENLNTTQLPTKALLEGSSNTRHRLQKALSKKN
ncbi:hypothetical protein DMENIID0001_154310 [Sergentomyia squamirostris]